MSQALRLNFEIADQAFERIWNNIRHIPDDFREPFEQMAEAFWKQEAQTFALEGQVEKFERWKPLSPRYKEWKEKHYPGQPILVRSGAMRDSLTNPHADGAIYEVYPQQMTLGTEIPYAIYHQTGSVRIPNHPPKRPPVLLTMGLRKNWTHIMTTWLREEFAYDGR